MKPNSLFNTLKSFFLFKTNISDSKELYQGKANQLKWSMKLHFSNMIKTGLISYHWPFLTLVTRVDSFANFLVSGLNLVMMTLIITSQ